MRDALKRQALVHSTQCSVGHPALFFFFSRATDRIHYCDGQAISNWIRLSKISGVDRGWVGYCSENAKENLLYPAFLLPIKSDFVFANRWDGGGETAGQVWLQNPMETSVLMAKARAWVWTWAVFRLVGHVWGQKLHSWKNAKTENKKETNFPSLQSRMTFPNLDDNLKIPQITFCTRM